jgi:hypothetical protein
MGIFNKQNPASLEIRGLVNQSMLPSSIVEGFRNFLLSGYLSNSQYHHLHLKCTIIKGDPFFFLSKEWDRSGTYWLSKTIKKGLPLTRTLQTLSISGA